MSMSKEQATEILNNWIADCDENGTPGNFEIRRANRDEVLQANIQGDFHARWVCVPAGSEFQARRTYRTLADVLHAHEVPGY